MKIFECKKGYGVAQRSIFVAATDADQAAAIADPIISGRSPTRAEMVRAVDASDNITKAGRICFIPNSLTGMENV